ncbi:MAG: AraC family transcriptional regulator [Herbiconiux sp.]|nr:AraC family transcriptional regulator [Herbiconiux sp.]
MRLASNPSCVLVQMRAVTVADGAVYRRMHRAAFGSVTLARIESVPQSVAAQLDEVPPHALESTQFQLVHRGRLVLEQAGEQTVFAAGELAVYDASVPFDFHYPEAFSTTIVQIPTVLLDRRARAGLPRPGHPIAAGSLGHQVLRDVLAAGRRPSHDVDAVSLSTALVDAMRLVAAEQVPDGVEPSRRVPDDELARAVLDHVHRNHTDPMLTAATIAARFHVSLRTLYGAFADRDETIGVTIRALRLRTAGRLLLTGDASVADVATAVGYTDVTAFIRAWQASTGETPGHWRRRIKGTLALSAMR